MAISFNGETTTVTLGSGVTEVDVVDDIYGAWKDWMLASPLNRKYPQAFRSDGGNPLSSIINQGSYIFLNNSAGWRIKPPEEDITIYLTGNLAVEDTTLDAFISTTGAYTAAILGLQPVTQGVTPVMATQLAYGSFQNAIHFDETSPWSGTGNTPDGEPIGNAANPVNNLEDVILLCAIWGLSSIHVDGDATIDSGGDYRGMYFYGESRTRSILTVTAAAQVDECHFYDAHIKGTLDGDSRLHGCKVDNLSYVNGEIERCELAPGTITLGGGAAAHFIDCWSGVPGVGTPTVDLGGSGQSLAVRGYDGGIKLINKSGTESVSIDLAAGQIRIDLTTVTNGTIVCRGDGKVVNDATGEYLVSGTYGSLVLLNETANPVSTSDAVWDEPVADHLTDGSFGKTVSHIGYTEHAVYIDTEAASNGDGTSHNPFNNVTDAIDFAEADNIKQLVVLADLTIDRQIKNFIITGIGAPTIDCNGQNLDKSEFKHCTMTGSYTGTIIAQESNLSGSFVLSGFFENCAMGSTFSISDSGWAFIKDCSAFVFGSTPPSIDIGGIAGTADLVVAGFNGGLKILNVSQVTDNVKLVMGVSKVILDTTCTAGQINVAGVTRLVDNSLGSTVVDETVDPEKLHKLYKAHYNKRTWNGVDTLTLYDDDTITPLQVFDTNSDMSEITPQ